MAALAKDGSNIYMVEHLDAELGPWSMLEYQQIAEESEKARVRFCLSSVPKSLQIPLKLGTNRNLVIEHRGVEDIFQAHGSRVCLLDPAATTELRPEDGATFDVFLFGGILGTELT